MAKDSAHAFASTLKSFKTASGKSGKFFSLRELASNTPTSTSCPCRSASCWSRFCATATGRK